MKKSLRSKRSSRISVALGLALAAGGMMFPAMAPAAPATPAVGEGQAGKRAIKIIAHRGGAMARPENTMPALHHAAGMGVEYLEFDMMMTRDNRVIVHHDAGINPEFCKSATGTTPAPVRDLTFAQTQTFDCGSAARTAYAGDRFLAVPGAHIPDLEEVLATFTPGDALFFAETKIPRGADVDPVLFATLLADAVRRHGLEDRLILQSFDFRTIDALHAINPRIRTCLLGVPRQTRDYLAMLRRHHARCIVLDHDEVDAAGVRALQQAGVLVFSGVADTVADWRKYVDLGFDALFTNDPEAATAFLRQ